MKYTLPMFQVSLTASNQPVSLYVGDIPMLAGNKTADVVADDIVESNSKDRLPAGTDGPYIPSLIKLFNHSGMQVQDLCQVLGEDLDWTALVIGVRGYPPVKPSDEISASSSPETKVKDSHRVENKDANGKKNGDDFTKKFMTKNQSLTFVPTVCVVRYAGSRTNNRNIDIECDFKNWIDADFWVDKRGREYSISFTSNFSTYFLAPSLLIN